MNKFLLFSFFSILVIFSSCEKEHIVIDDEIQESKIQDLNFEIDTRSVSDALVIINNLIVQVKQLYQDDLITKQQKNYLVRKLKKVRKKLNKGQINKAISRINNLIVWLESCEIDPEIAADLTAQLNTAKCEAAPVDEDGDGFLCNEDCDDTDANINADATEVPGNGIDDNCNGEVDEALICTGEDGYDAVSFTDIESAELSSTVLDGSDNVYNEIPAGTVVVYKTNEGRYGKLLIESIGVAMQLSWTTYESDGTIFSQGTSLTINGTFSADLDLGEESVDFNTSDFWWEAVDGIDRFVVPLNSAIFAIYSCEEVEQECTGDFAFGGINYHDILQSTLSSAQINASDNASNLIPEGTIVLYSTNSGNVGKLLVTEYNNTLVIKYRTYRTNGVTEGESSDFSIPQTTTVDMDSGVIGDFPLSDIWWQHVDEVERYLTPLDGSLISLYNCAD